MKRYLDFTKIDKDNETLLDIKKESVARQCELLEPTREEMKEIQTKVDPVVK